MSYQEQVKEVLGKILGTYQVIRMTLDSEYEYKMTEDEVNEEEKESADAESVEGDNHHKQQVWTKNNFGDSPVEKARLQSLKVSQGIDNFNGAATKGKGSVNANTTVLNKQFRSQKDGKK